MKKIKRIRFLLSKNKQARKALALVCFMLLMLGAVLVGMKLLDDNGRVSAHPTNPLTVTDENGNNAFNVPIDGGAVFEQSLTSQTPRFNNYLQNDEIVAILEKKIVDATGAAVSELGTISVAIRAIEKTTYGNYVVLYGFAGSNKGGLIKVAVFNKEGQLLAENLVGKTTDIALRINTGFYNVSNNAYLVGTQDGSFFRYEISGESNTAASINRVKLTTTDNPNTGMKANYHIKVNTFSTYSDDSIIVGRINTSNSTHEGKVKHRVPFAAINVNGWEGSGFSGASSYLFSVENLLNTDPEINLPNEGVQVVTTPTNIFYNNDGKVYGTFSNSHYDGVKTTSKLSFQVFDTNEDIQDPLTGENLKKRKYSYATNRELLVLEEICTDDHAYFLVVDSPKTKLIEVDLNTYASREIQTFPRLTRIKLINNSDGTISYFGSTSSLTDNFYSDYYSNNLTGANYFISGLMKGITDSEPLKTISVRALETNGFVLPTKIIDSGNNQLFMGGSTADKDKFVDKLSLYHEAVPPATTGDPSSNMGFIGVLEINDDYSPAIKGEKDITVDITNNAVANPSPTNYRNWNTLDRWLITGKENGLMSDDTAINVYDQVDSNDTSLGATPQDRENALQMKINRNPLSISSPIDWSGLGFDKTKAGPQLITYFVSDSQGQASVTSRWVNKETSQTIIDDDNKFALDAQNFHIPLADLETTFNVADADKVFKKLAKTTAWDLVNHGTGDGDHGEGLDEDGEESKFSSKVTVDANQLKALREATVAKPYPVDVTYTTGVSGITIRNRVWVFATTKNTLPNTKTNPAITPKDTNGVVYYADDYTIPYRLRKTQTNNKVLENGNVKVYDYFDASNETSVELPTLADATNNPNKLVVSLPTIHDALAPGKVTPSVTYKWDGPLDANHKDGSISGNETIGHLDITLTGNVLFHVRQVVLNESGEIVVPTEGYFDIKNIKNNGGNPAVDPDYQANLTGKSGLLADEPGFTDIAVDTDQLTDLADQVQMSVVVPEFYNLLGYYQTTQLADANGASHANHSAYTAGPLLLSKNELNQGEEFWVTFYVQPNVDGQDNPKTPQPYSWDYKKNDLGKIKTK